MFMPEKEAVALIALPFAIVLLFIPFIDKPVHMDDASFISWARAARLPFGTVPGVISYYLGMRIDNTPSFSGVHALMPYTLKLISTLVGGESEISIHLLLLVFPVVLAIGVWGISEEMGIPFIPSLLVILGNASFLPIAHNMMADAPSFSLWTFSVFLFIRALRTGKKGLMAVSSIVLILSIGYSYQYFFFALLFSGFLLARGRRGHFPFFALPLALVITAAGAMLIHGFSLTEYASEAARGLDQKALAGKALCVFITTGLMSAPFSAFIFMDSSDCKTGITGRYTLIGSIVIACLGVYFVRYPLPESIFLAVLIAMGIVTIHRVVTYALRCHHREKDMALLLLLSYLIVVIWNICFMPFGAARYLLPILLPISVLLMKTFRGTGRTLLPAVLTALLGLTVAYADYVFASSYRSLPGLIKKDTGGTLKRTWFVGDWGMQYYMLREGSRYLTNDSDAPETGDLIFISSVQKIRQPSERLLKRMKLIDELAVESSFPVKVMDAEIKAGYYSNLWGHLPFTISGRPVEKIGVFRVVR